MPVAEGTRITIRLPDDFHHHARDGAKTPAVLQHAVKRFGNCLFMPNLKPPLVNTEMALKYRQHIMDSLPKDAPDAFKPQMTIYLTDKTSPDEIKKAYATGLIVAVKYYPAGATTNSDFGVSDFKKVYPVFKAMEEVGMKLCIHSEVTYGDIFDREPAFIEEILRPLVSDFPKLRIIMEHISTKEAVDYMLEAPDNIKASITCHHLLFNRNALLVGGVKPHLYCLPILKAEVHREALIQAATSGSSKFFLGTDSAPHPTDAKESACGCAGVYTAHAAIELYAEAFDSMDALDKLEGFCSSHGADHYGLPRNTQTITLEKKSWDVPKKYDFGDGATVTPLRAGEQVAWSIVS
mmetsp:Transcript_7754/g.11113  ORF Transcript_7754/g.11113 Transcript_7754/m.11113 type:complete len:351 (-) Transcript_7754:107-1159(-)